MEAASEAARMAGKLLLNGLGEDLGTTSKGRNDFVTVMDVRSEELIKHHLHTLFPYDNFLGEEMGYEQYGDGGTWIIDPIDGTTNYIHGIPGYTISIAYEEKKWDPVVEWSMIRSWMNSMRHKGIMEPSATTCPLRFPQWSMYTNRW